MIPPADISNNYEDLNKRTSQWLYTTSYVILMIAILTLSSVLPIDVIVQSKTNNSHLATNTVIILVVCVAFMVFSILIHMIRLFYNKILMQDIPKPYVPINENDIGKQTNHKINLEMIRCEKIKNLAMPKGNIKHPGLFHHSINNLENELPDNLIYENIIKVIGQELKYNGTLTISDEKVLQLNNFYSLRELLLNKENFQNDKKLQYFLDLYEKLRFSGQPIECNEFKEFLKYWNYVKSKL